MVEGLYAGQPHQDEEQVCVCVEEVVCGVWLSAQWWPVRVEGGGCSVDEVYLVVCSLMYSFTAAASLPIVSYSYSISSYLTCIVMGT